MPAFFVIRRYQEAINSDEVRAVSLVIRYQLRPLVIFLAGVLISGTATWLYMSRGQLVATVDASVPTPTAVAAEARSARLSSSVPVVNFDVDTKLDTSELVLSTPLDSSPPPSIDHPSSPLVVTEKPAQTSNSKPGVLLAITAELPAVEFQSSAADAPSKVKTLPNRTSTAPLASGKTTSTTQQSDNLYRQSVMLLQRGQVDEAQKVLRKSLALNVYNLKARQALVGLLLDNNDAKEASEWLKDGLSLSPMQSIFSMALARLQLESGDSKDARDTLEAGLSYADEEANYHAFYAALLQRDEQHKVAIQHYLIALQADPGTPTWLVGIGISLQAEGEFNDATAAYQRARDTARLTPQLTQFLDSRLKQISQR